MQRAIAELLRLDYDAVAEKIGGFVKATIAETSAKGLVMGLSGGLDSSVLAKVCAEAIGPEKILGFALPSRTTPKQDTDDGIKLAESLGIACRTVGIDPILSKYMEFLPHNVRAEGNLMARIRANILYHHAFVNGMLVAGTSDKSELYIGYFTKYGDGAADLLPIADLYKTQVRALGKHIGVPSAILEKKSSPRLWEGHEAEAEIGMQYEDIDIILHALVDKKLGVVQAAAELGIGADLVQKVKSMVDRSAHKRQLGKIARLDC